MFFIPLKLTFPHLCTYGYIDGKKSTRIRKKEWFGTGVFVNMNQQKIQGGAG
jgi:hypothetical protein